MPNLIGGHEKAEANRLERGGCRLWAGRGGLDRQFLLHFFFELCEVGRIECGLLGF